MVRLAAKISEARQMSFPFQRPFVSIKKFQFSKKKFIASELRGCEMFLNLLIIFFTDAFFFGEKKPSSRCVKSLTWNLAKEIRSDGGAKWEQYFLESVF